MKTIPLLTAIVFTAIIVPTSIYALQYPSKVALTPGDAALAFVRDSATFKFDGVTSTLKVVDSAPGDSSPSQYIVTVSFQCLHGGYGDRTGQAVTEAVTPHTVAVNVVDGKVVSAVIDGSWDELAQRSLADEAKASAEETATSWLLSSPTFKFDGVPGSIKVVDSWQAMTLRAPSFWEVTIEFDCLHAGYGDRSGQMVAQVVTHHVAVIHVTSGVVDLAQLDSEWDELKQAPIASPTILTPEQARDIAASYVIKSLGLDVTTPGDWKEVNVPQALLGVKKTSYVYGDWNVTIQYPVVWKPTYTITIVKGTSTSWRGTVDQNGEVTPSETQPDVSQLFYTPDIARKMCVDYIIANHPEAGAPIQTQFTEKNLVAEGIVGLTKIQYAGDGWTITVQAPVVWKTTYNITASYSGPSGSFTWKGSLPQGGTITEISFSK